MILLEEDGKGLLVEGGILGQLGELDGHLVDGAEAREAVVGVVEGLQHPEKAPCSCILSLQLTAVLRKEMKRGWATTSAKDGGIFKLSIRLTQI